MSMKDVETFFTKGADAFDSIYSGKKAWWSRLLDKALRQDIYLRHEATVDLLGDVRGKKILDIGCGSGRLALDLAARGALVTGVDFSEPMIAMANKFADGIELEGSVDFQVGDFLTMPIDESFDAVTALGFFDYTEDSMPYLERARGLTTGKLVGSFPKRWSYRTPLRKVRLKILGCPVFFFSRSDLDDMFTRSRFNVTRVDVLPNSYLAVGDVVE